MLTEPIVSRRHAISVKLYRDVPHPRPEIEEYTKLQRHNVHAYMLGSDVAGGVVLALLTFWLYATPLRYDPQQLWMALAGFALAWPLGAYLQDLYGRAALRGTLYKLVLRTAATCALAFGILLFFGFAFNQTGGVSRVWLLTWAAALLTWTSLTRILWRVYLRRMSRNGGCLERVLVLAGTGQAAHGLAEMVERESDGHIRVAAAAAMPGTFGAPTFDWVEEAVRGGFVDRVIVGRFDGAMAQTNALLARLTRLTIDVSVLPDLEGLQAPVVNVDHIGMMPAVELDFRPLTRVQVHLKRIEDLVLASLITLFMAPVLAIISLAIKLDSPGAVLFRQQGTGFNGRVFMVWKFRTMYVRPRDEKMELQTSRGDRRVTRVGSFLRRSSLDELPQLFNVLIGDMSIVGPRPHPLGMKTVGLPLREAIEGYSARYRLKPGITGWAQVSGNRGEVDSIEKLRHRVALDCHYIEHWSLGLDFWIIARTAAMVVYDPNAY